MKRMGRIIYNGATAVSLLLLLATVAVWVRSYWVGDMVYWCDWPSDYAYNHFRKAISSRGGLELVSAHYEGDYLPAFETRGLHYFARKAGQYPVTSNRNWYGPYQGHRSGALGFALASAAATGPNFGPQASYSIQSLTLPFYFLTFLFALLPAHYLLRVRRRRRIAGRLARGCCPSCGYDMRASLDQCPECGLAAADRAV
jgi:hypothetical protein